ncbi:MAG TPA: hypothetical protein VFY18_06260 [Candidatus Limnocylindrales bacterium]|nr:hypothetical protein [Candidatus Limnocylindrales bacterium]
MPDARAAAAPPAPPAPADIRQRPVAAITPDPTTDAEVLPEPAASPVAGPDREGGEPLSRLAGPEARPAAGAEPNGAIGAPDRRPALNGSRPPNGPPVGMGGTCTAPQLRRFIKSRPYVPMHELRRRFGIDGGEDDVTPVDLSSGRIYVGLPSREGSLLGELMRGGEVGFELSLDPRSPIVVGLYPMRPVARS